MCSPTNSPPPPFHPAPSTARQDQGTASCNPQAKPDASPAQGGVYIALRYRNGRDQHRDAGSLPVGPLPAVPHLMNLSGSNLIGADGAASGVRSELLPGWLAGGWAGAEVGIGLLSPASSQNTSQIGPWVGFAQGFETSITRRACVTGKHFVLVLNMVSRLSSSLGAI